MTHPDADLVISNIGQLLTMVPGEGNPLGIVENACVAMNGSRITYAGPAQEFETKRQIDAGGRPVCPGFIDPHTHLIFGGWRADEFERRLQGESYQAIAAEGGGILRSVQQTREASFEKLVHHGHTILDRMLCLGTTTVEAKSGYGLNVEDELKILRATQQVEKEHPIDVISTFLGAHEVPAEYRPNTDSYVDFVIDEQLPAVKEQGFAEFVDVFLRGGSIRFEAVGTDSHGR